MHVVLCFSKREDPGAIASLNAFALPLWHTAQRILAPALSHTQELSSDPTRTSPKHCNASARGTATQMGGVLRYKRGRASIQMRHFLLRRGQGSEGTITRVLRNPTLAQKKNCKQKSRIQNAGELAT